MSGPPYIALFCPHCGGHVNESELDTDHDLLANPETPNMGSVYTCYWCKEMTRDWNHVIRCRTEHEQTLRLRHIQRGQDLQRMLGEISLPTTGCGKSPAETVR